MEIFERIFRKGHFFDRSKKYRKLPNFKKIQKRSPWGLNKYFLRNPEAQEGYYSVPKISAVELGYSLERDDWGSFLPQSMDTYP